MFRTAPLLPAALVVAALLLAVAGSGAAPDLVKVSTIPVPEDRRVKDTALTDLDGDGARDLILQVGGRPEDFDRVLRIHLRRPGPVAFSPEPDRELRLTRDVVAFAPVELDGRPGAEIVLLTATGAFSWRWDPGEEEWPVRFADADFLWQVPHGRWAFHYRGGARDLDRDGRVDLVLPEPGGYRVVFRREDGGSSVSALRLPDAAESGKTEGEEGLRVERKERTRELAVTLRMGGDEGPEDVVGVTDAVPDPALLDYDADGRTDLLARDGDDLLVWLCREGGGFGREPDVRRPLPLEVDRSRSLDFSFGIHGADLDGDRRADCVILAGDRRSRDLRTQVLVYRQAPDRPLFGEGGTPQQALFVGGFAGGVYLTDVDGNGLPDLVLGRVDVDAVDLLRSAGRSRLSSDLHVHLNERGVFSRQPSLALSLELPADSLSEVGESLSARFAGDVTGNGVSDLLLRDRPDRLRVLALRRTREGLDVMPEPLFETRIDRKAVLQVLEGDPPEVLVLERGRVLHVRFR